MPVTLKHNTEGRYLEVFLRGKLERSDYATFVPEFESLMRQHGKLRLLVVLDDFHGWTAGALWEDVKFDAKHFRDIGRLAIVGEKTWHEAMAQFCKPFTTAVVKYFHQFEVDDARAWLSKEAAIPAGHRAD